MADADEDIIPRGAASGEDGDLTDETQDFRFLASFSCVPLTQLMLNANFTIDVKMQQYQNEAKRTSSLIQQPYKQIL
jgi:hypothetical protein